MTRSDGRRFVEIDEVELERSHGFVVDTKPDNVPVHIIDNIYLGSQDCVEVGVLERFGIRKVLSIGVEVPSCPVTYKFAPCLDLPETDLRSVLSNCIEFMCSDERTLLHCNAGVSRAPAVVVGYLMVVHKFSFQEAYDLVKTKRPCVCPNVGFVRQLMELGKD